ncbi:MAG: SDR family NAD(P)-dependent oxidoreductase [Candidatus Marinimicrobia bacterium]|nr:SDR family NAD(P)-dependent oxidoreductase [Candidatus Neomarinimicrobiota bacterium]
MELNFEIPNLTGKITIVTGANSGIGLETARAFAAHGATVVMACRNLEKAQSAASEIRNTNPKAKLDLLELDLASLESVRKFADDFSAKYDRLDILANNAGVMALPEHYKTADGFEMQFGTNHLGHFALTGFLLPLIKKTAAARVITVASMAHNMGKFDQDNLNAEKGYKKSSVYGLTKLSNLLFAYELQRKFENHNIDSIAVAAHPGWTATNLQQYMGVANFLNRFIAQTPPMGALPTIRAAVASNVNGGEYYGPKNWGGWRGPAVKVQSNASSHNETDAAALWVASEKLTGVNFNWET